MTTVSALRLWGRLRWLVAAGSALLGVLVVGVPTDLIDTPLFGRQVPPTWWSWPALLVSAVLGGLLAASYVRDGHDGVPVPDAERADRTWGSAGGVLTFFAVGCPVCNKIVLLALGTSGALAWFAPVQPLISVLAVALLGWALRRRLRGQLACPVRGLPGGV